MELKDFITETLIQMMEGVKQVQEKIAFSHIKRNNLFQQFKFPCVYENYDFINII